MIFLTGFMGSGKTTVGRELSSLLSRPFVDLDEVITGAARTTIPEIFRHAGEEAFRLLEKNALAGIAGRTEQAVVATGGGLPAAPANRELMKACGVIVHLRASFETLQQRIPSDSNRPLWNGDARSLLAARTAAYEDADLIIDTDGSTPRELAEQIWSQVEGCYEPIPVILPDRAYPVYIGDGIFRDFPALLGRHAKPEGVFVLADENVLRLHRGAIKESLSGFVHHIMEVPPGEESKSYAFLGDVLREMFVSRVNRNWMCVAVGGGVTGDLGGFAASIYMRGIPVVHVATTLLAQVDSSIGGKTAVNSAFGKNLVGTFHQPLFVLSDVGFLGTLDDIQMKNGLAEAVKYGIIMDKGLFGYLENGPPFDPVRLVTSCSRDKALVVGRDEREGGVRRILNFGHTLGHAIEQVRNYSISHGQAVAAGMVFAAWLSRELGLLEKEGFERIQALIRREGIIPEGFAFPGPDEVAGAIAMDKKGSREGLHFVLTPAIGDVTVKKLIDSEVLEAYTRFLHGFEKGL